VPVPDTVVVGRVGKPHGLDGAFFVEDPSDDPERFHAGADLLAGGRSFRVVESKRVRGRAVIRLDGRVERGTMLEVLRDELPPPQAGSYYVFQLVGLQVEEEGGGDLGRVVDVTPGVANDVLELESGVLLPMVEECVQEIDVEGGRILVAPGFADAG
jgi:16S rRNA processing protein RimM